MPEVNIVDNELTGWISVLAGLAAGLYMGVKFRREDWLGGYSAFSRRMVRLAHVALVALGILNIQFAQSLPRLHLGATAAQAASLGFIGAAVFMPACCLWVAVGRRPFEIFAAPVLCLATGLILTIGGLLA
jgi:glucose-6-phosphate-specific signal transduction histidine kinase